jgi:hypothetical protein
MPMRFKAPSRTGSTDPHRPRSAATSRRVAFVSAVGIVTTAGLLATATSAFATTTSTAPAAASSAYPAGTLETGATDSTLLSIYASFRHIPAGDVAGVLTGSLTEASVGSTQWAIADFLPSLSAPAAVQNAFQDGAGTAVFSSTGSSAGSNTGTAAWQVTQTGVGLSCSGVLPVAVQQALGLTNTAGCAGLQSAPASTAAAQSEVPASGPSRSKISASAVRNVGVADNPVVHSFNGLDCDPYTTLVGNPDGATQAGCGRNARFNVKNTSEFWCADFAKWVWEIGGVTSDLNLLTPGAASFWSWGHAHKEAMKKDSQDFQVGDAIVFYAPGVTINGKSADHVGIISAVDAKTKTITLVNGDFLGSKNISVQKNGPIKFSGLQAWADSVWDRKAANPEKWILVNPLP